jgi:hypothetical protein
MRAFPHPGRKELVHFLCHEYRELLWKSQCTSGDPSSVKSGEQREASS